MTWTMEEKPPVIAVAGPTASGKTAFGIALSRYYGGEIVSCDSMQIYRGLPIGTAQPSKEELSAVPHHLIGFLEVGEPFSVSDYVNLAARTIEEIHERGNMPVLVGGTGLYLRSLLRGFTFEENCRDQALRDNLYREAEELGAEEMHNRLNALDPQSAREIHPNNVKRTLRALEYCLLSGEPFSAQAERSKQAESPYRYHILCLSFRNRETLYRRIDQRVDKMMASGLLEEARRFFDLCELCKGERSIPTASQAIGYKELFPYFRGEISLEEAVDKIKMESRRYAKRQITWFSREKQISFLYVDEMETEEALLSAGVSALLQAGIQGKEGKSS